MSKSRVRSPSVVLPAKVLLPLRMLGAALITALAVGLMVPVPSAGATPSEPVQRGGDIDGEAVGDQSGFSVALSADGDTMAIGAWLNDPTIDGILANNAGHVRIYRWNGSVWDQRGGDIDGEAAGDQSGRSVALSADGDTVAIGAHLNDGNGDAAGHVRIYAWDGAGWDQRGGDIDGEAAGDTSGRWVALSADGDTVAIGAPGNGGSGSNAGHVRVVAFADNGAGAALPPSVSCAPLPPVAGASVTCTVTGGDAGIDILWRAAYNPVIAETGVTLDASGSGTFSFTVPAAALGEELTVELVDWTAPMSLGVVGGPVPTSVPSGEGPVPAWSLVLAVLIAFGLLRRRAFGSVEGGRRSAFSTGLERGLPGGRQCHSALFLFRTGRPGGAPAVPRSGSRRQSSPLTLRSVRLSSVRFPAFSHYGTPHRRPCGLSLPAGRRHAPHGSHSDSGRPRSRGRARRDRRRPGRSRSVTGAPRRARLALPDHAPSARARRASRALGLPQGYHFLTDATARTARATPELDAHSPVPRRYAAGYGRIPSGRPNDREQPNTGSHGLSAAFKVVTPVRIRSGVPERTAASGSST